MGRAALSLAAALAAIPAIARADGARVDSHKSTPQVVEESTVIATARVLLVKHQYRVRRAYGSDHKYVSRYSVKVKLESFVRGEPGFDNAHGANRTFWVDGRAHGVPGKWVIINDYYGSDRVFGGLKRGDRFILYLRTSHADKGHLQANEIDRMDRLELVKKLVGKAALERRTRARAAAVAANKPVTCEAIDTYKRGESCQSPAEIAAAHACPRGRDVHTLLSDGGLLIVSCRDRRNRPDGPFAEMRPLGSLRREGAFARGKLHGLVIDRGPDGQVTRTTCYRRGNERWRAEGAVRGAIPCP